MACLENVGVFNDILLKALNVRRESVEMSVPPGTIRNARRLESNTECIHNCLKNVKISRTNKYPRISQHPKCMNLKTLPKNVFKT